MGTHDHFTLGRYFTTALCFSCSSSSGDKSADADTEVAPSVPGAPSDTVEQSFETEGGEMDDPDEISGYEYDSGITALLAIARSVTDEEAPESRRTIVFATWGIEEDPFYVRGSKAFFKALDDTGTDCRDKIVDYLNFDMIGAYSDYKSLNVLGTYENSPATTLFSSITPNYSSIQVDMGERGEASDHETFCTAGIPYAFFWTQDKCYHQPCDTPSKIDKTNLSTIIRVAADLTKALAVEHVLAGAKTTIADDYAAQWPSLVCTDQGE